MGIFDASNRDQCEVVRSKTNTPLQALVMMNDPTVLEASRVLAQKLMQEKSTADAKITKPFAASSAGSPDGKRAHDPEKLLRRTGLFRQKKLDAAKTLDVGEYPTAKIGDRNARAALMQVVNTIYNMEEAITKT